MLKNILGLDLGTTSIGFAHVIENEKDISQSEIRQIGVRIIQYDNFVKIDKSGKVSESKNPEQDFASGKGLSPNAGRTLKRGARRTLDRYQDRRSNLINTLFNANIITHETKLAEDGKNTTHSTFALRAKAVVSKIEKDELARVFLAINKKRGYKSSRKAKNEDEGQAIDGMAIAKRLYEDGLTAGQLVLNLLREGKKTIPDFYRSDLLAEFDKVWSYQNQFYPEILTNEFKKELEGKGQRATAGLFWICYQFNTAENKAKSREEKKLQAYQLRSDAVSRQLEKEEVAYVIAEINNNLNNSSGYLGAISDRSKELYFKQETVGQYLYRQLQKNPHTKLKNQVFYRQDYLDEFEAIWKEQAKHHPELTAELKTEVRDITIFYQRKLKSQKGLISFCEFESKEIAIDRNGQQIKQTVGLKVIPKSSHLFQEFKILQRLNDVLIRKKGSKKRVAKNTDAQGELFQSEEEIFVLDHDTKQDLFIELNLKGNLPSSKIIELLGYKPADWEMNFSQLEGNKTNQSLYNAYLKIIENEGYDLKELLKIKINRDEIELNDLDTPATEIKKMVSDIFDSLGIDTSILEFDAELEGKLFEQQPSYKLWHLLYAYEGDNSSSGNEKLYKLLEKKFGFNREQSKVLASVTFLDDYGSLSTKAIRKIYPFIKENNYSTACELAGYRHSASSLTKEEIAKRPLKDRLELLKKNSLRNPVVEKILNQVVNVINALIVKNSERDENGTVIKAFHFDEIRIELARDLKRNAEERREMTANINSAKISHDKIFKLLQNEFGIKNPTRSDIIRFKLFDELKNNGYKDLYTNTYIPREILFSKQIDIDHIIPQAKLFDDSFSNKTVIYRRDNLDKGNKTAFDYILSKYGELASIEYQQRIANLFEQRNKSKDDASSGINKAKYQKLLKREIEIGDGFIERDLRNSQYIAKKTRNMLFEISRVVTPTTGSITDRLREDWDLINIMQELNFDKFKKLGLTEMVEKKDGTFKERIVDWTKRNDHRHHAMDALTVAFTKHNHIQYLNYLNARKDETHKLHNNIIGIETLETDWKYDDQGNKKRVFKSPLINFREQAKDHLENVLVSHKPKNKVTSKNKNQIAGKDNPQIVLTPRGQLHKETVYGKYKYYVSKEERIGGNFDLATIEKVSNPAYKKLLFQRLAENGNDPKKAFTGKNAIGKNPIYLDATQLEQVPEKIKLVWLEEDYSVRKDVTPENFKDEKAISKILDQGIKEILLDRLRTNKGDSKKAFSDLDKNPVWLNEKEGIAIKRVKISGVKNAEPLHHKKDHLGNSMLDKEGKEIPVDFVSTGNNHHVAIYRDDKGNLQDNVVSFFEAVQLVSTGEPVIDKSYNRGLGWQFLFTMKQNEFFVFPNDKTGFNPKEIDLLNPKNAKVISPHLFRTQKLSKVTYGNSAVRDYVFRHHLETSVEEKNELNGIAYKQLKSLAYLEGAVKVRLNHLGEVVKVGEY
ncbi:type II CRISPR RNA-guided endonuclease Cas9 [Pedobacter sp. HMF7647]|uniref:CRISPR-associated endonuclease Cas9 n=1 Tax=Hufsiella arboris TaxID=2695275 RepID=A0A7K1Y8D9_9SPHI|nr:type II CRISPR RNA-guided endonuclease Cas9 [Hufsiella arboris]MXV50863.1 type II CRISPR RNA-guided endonuclease Cas9 [Hufsiella arboris]